MHSLLPPTQDPPVLTPTVMTLFSDESTISEEVPIDYENKVTIYDDYCDDMYAIKSNDNHETCHLDFNF